MIFNLLLLLLIILVYLLTHLGNKDKKSKDNLFLLIVFVLFFILIGSREMTRGNDTLNYLKSFKYFSVLKWDSNIFDNYYEPGYVIINILLSYISSSSRFFLVIMSFIMNYTIYNFIKDNSKNYLMSTIMYLGLMFFFSSMTMTRQFLALCITLYGFKYIKNRKFLKYLLVVLVASLFHTSSIVSLLVYPCYNSKYTNKKAIIIFVASVVVMLSLNTIYPWIAQTLSKETYYLDRIGSFKIINLITSFIFLVMYLFSYSIAKKKNLNNNNSFYLFIFLITFCSYMISINMAVLERVALYFSIYTIIALPNMFYFNNVKNAVFLNIVITILLFMYSSTIMIYRPDWNTSFDYKTCIFPKSGYICK